MHYTLGAIENADSDSNTGRLAIAIECETLLLQKLEQVGICNPPHTSSPRLLSGLLKTTCK